MEEENGRRRKQRKGKAGSALYRDDSQLPPICPTGRSPSPSSPPLFFFFLVLVAGACRPGGEVAANAPLSRELMGLDCYSKFIL